jgi:hypothetical protein
MEQPPEEIKPAEPEMHHREITLSDGRYMVFYTFEDVPHSASRADEQGEDV